MDGKGEGFKRVSDCPLGDEEERKKKKQDALSPQPPIAILASSQSQGKEGGWGAGKIQLDATLPLDTANSAGSLAVWAQLRAAQPNVAI